MTGAVGPTGAGGSGGSGSTLADTVFVAKNGVDAGADGSVGNPFLTVQAALNYAYATYVAPALAAGDSATRPTVFVNAGVYDDGNLVLPPNVMVVGESNVSCHITGNWSIDARWSLVEDLRSGLRALTVRGMTTIDFRANASPGGKFIAQDVRFGDFGGLPGTLVATEDTTPSAEFNQVLLQGCELFGNVTLNGSLSTLNDCVSFNAAAAVTFNQVNGSAAQNAFFTSGGSLGTVAINATFAAPATPSQVLLQHNQQAFLGFVPGLTITGTFVTINADTNALPTVPNVTFAGGATAAQISIVNPLGNSLDRLGWNTGVADITDGNYVGWGYVTPTAVRGAITVAFAGTISNLFARASGAVNGIVNFIVYVNGVATAIDATLAATDRGSDTTHEVDVATGDVVAIFMTSPVPNTGIGASVGLQFQSPVVTPFGNE